MNRRGRVQAETIVLLFASAAMLAILIWAGRHLTFWYDEWSIILDRPDPSAASLLAPHVDHLSVVPIAIYQTLLRIVGLSSYWPYLAVTWAGHFTSVWLLYRIIGRRADQRIALVAAISLLALGSAYEDLLHAWQMSFVLSTAGGLFAIDRLDADASPRGTAIAAGSLLFAIAASSVGVIILGVVLAWGVLARERRVVLATAPVILLYGAWYLTWGLGGRGPAIAEATLPVIAGSLAFGLGAVVAAVTGLAPSTFAPIGLVVGVLATIRGWMQGLRLSALGVAACLGLLALYLLQALFRAAEFGIEHAARSGYLYPAAIFLWLAVGDALSTQPLLRIRSPLAVIILTMAALAIAGNLAQLQGAATAMRGLRISEIGILRLVEQLRGSLGLALDRSPDEELVPQVTPRRYYVAIDRFGPPKLDTTGAHLQDADAARLNRAALILLGDAFSVGQFRPTGSAPIVHLEGTGVIVVVADGCSIARISGGEAVASWMIAPGTGFRVSDELAPRARLLLGIHATSPQPPPAVVDSGLATGEAILPPLLPSGFSWYAQLEVPGPGSLRICSVVADAAGTTLRSPAFSVVDAAVLHD